MTSATDVPLTSELISIEAAVTLRAMDTNLSWYGETGVSEEMGQSILHVLEEESTLGASVSLMTEETKSGSTYTAAIIIASIATVLVLASAGLVAFRHARTHNRATQVGSVKSQPKLQIRNRIKPVRMIDVEVKTAVPDRGLQIVRA